MVPETGFEPVITILKIWCLRPLDHSGMQNETFYLRGFSALFDGFSNFSDNLPAQATFTLTLSFKSGLRGVDIEKEDPWKLSCTRLQMGRQGSSAKFFRTG